MKSYLVFQHERGQSSAEAAISLLLFSVVIALIIQLLWIFLAQQLLSATTLSAARFIARSSTDNSGLHVLVQNRLRAIPGIELHLPRIKRLAPSDETIKSQAIFEKAQRRYRLPAEFPEVSISLLPTAEKQEEYLRARVLQIEIMYCFSLRVPLASQIITSIIGSDLYCAAQQRHRPMLAITTKATVPLENDFWL